jgi:hypothetical protein
MTASESDDMSAPTNLARFRFVARVRGIAAGEPLSASAVLRGVWEGTLDAAGYAINVEPIEERDDARR